MSYRTNPVAKHPCSLLLLVFSPLVVLLAVECTSASTLSTSENSFDLTFMLDAATFEDSAFPAQAGVDFTIIVDVESVPVTFMSGDGARTGESSFQVNGSPFVSDPNNDVFLTVGGTLNSVQTGTASASTVGSSATGGTEITWNLDIANESLENILLDFSYSYTRHFRLENSVAGNQAAAFVDDVTAFIEDFEGFSQTVPLIEDQNFGNLNANVFEQTFPGNGTFQLLINAENSDSALATLNSHASNNVVINVPEPTSAALLLASAAPLFLRSRNKGFGIL